MKSQNHLGLFAKFWQPGKVKTRLAAKIGNQPASAVYRQFLLHLLSRLGDAADVRVVVFSPEKNRPEFASLCGKPWSLIPQVDGDLGVRLRHFFCEQLQDNVIQDLPDGERKVVVIGSDCPLVDTELIRQAFERLEDHPVVIGPSKDGGYYLIGMRGHCPDMFENIHWSSSQVFRQTVARLQDLQIGYAILEEMEDVDDWDGLLRLLSRLKVGHSQRSASAHATDLLNRLQIILSSNVTEELR